jgi:hypothetical protein
MAEHNDGLPHLIQCPLCDSKVEYMMVHLSDMHEMDYIDMRMGEENPYLMMSRDMQAWADHIRQVHALNLLGGK